MQTQTDVKTKSRVAPSQRLDDEIQIAIDAGEGNFQNAVDSLIQLVRVDAALLWELWERHPGVRLEAFKTAIRLGGTKRTMSGSSDFGPTRKSDRHCTHRSS